ncbi:MAG: S-methyl-5-thioribose-1-phosphate isomerase [Phycisphaerales bacterium]|nr:MAG: S-methyl-5-thioribose-1-phosphate isomerase [Phycisphaerales bacterium]
MAVEALKWVGDVDGYLELVDQRRLPGELVKLQCRGIEQLHEAIRTLAVRGAPAIGVSAAYGLVLAAQKPGGRDSLEHALKVLGECGRYLASSRPTAVNLFWALERVRRCAEEFVAAQPNSGLRDLRRAILTEAHAVYQEDVEMCRRIGENGQHFIREGSGVLTHCNAGALATAGQGTALSVMFEAKKSGRNFTVYADETRPLLQGARLTAWELKEAGIDVVLVCDSMAGWLMKQGKVNAVITGADRIAANGDTANKIGTYSLSILAKKHSVPFYVAAPSSTFDLSITSGADIPIEQRDADEVTSFAGARIAPDDIDVCNPAFDVTEARDISAIITERGVIENPDARSIAQHLAPETSSQKQPKGVTD